MLLPACIAPEYYSQTHVWLREVDKDLAEEIRQFRSPADDETRMFYEIVVAPSYTPDGLAHLKGKSKTLRILESQPRAPTGRSLRQISGARLATSHPRGHFA